MNAIVTIWLKELREALRDRRTLISMFVIPTVVMPGLFLLIGAVTYKVVNKAKSEAPAVMLIGGVGSPDIRQSLEASGEVLLVPYADDWRRQISDKELRAAVELPDDFSARVAAGDPVTVKLYHYAGELKSGFALEKLRDFFNERAKQTVVLRLEERGLPPTLVEPFKVESENVAPPEKVGGNAIGGLLPYLFVLLCFTGGLYPAIDLTAGEKERGTLETLLSSPVRRIDIVLGKFLTVVTASIATVICSLVATGLCFALGGKLLAGAEAASQVGKAAAEAPATLPLLDPYGVLGVVAMLLPIAVFFAAVQLAVALYARSYKEAQSLLTPMVAAVIMPAVIGMLPGVELNPKLALVPILNLSLVGKEMVSGVFNWGYIGIVFGSTCAYAAAALYWCARRFNREDVIFRA